MNRRNDWVTMPSFWIENGQLQEFAWLKGQGADNLAALMILTSLLHNAERETGCIRLTYDQINEATDLSRSKISNGLDKLVECEIIFRDEIKQSYYQLCNYDLNQGWAKFPAKVMYVRKSIRMFNDFTLRKRTELDALKLYFLFASRRDRNTNYAHITYDQIAEASGINRIHIKSAISLLVTHTLLHVEHNTRDFKEYGVACSYRLAKLEAQKNMATTHRHSF